jgi:hypothetical protein
VRRCRRPPSRTAGSSRGCARAKAEVAARIERFDFSHAALELYDFVYGELCDWYLELVKPRLRDGDPADCAATLLHVLTETVALAHPLIPFVTEEIYAHIPGARGCSRRASRRRPAEPIDEAAEAAVEQRRSPPCRRSGPGATHRGQGVARSCRRGCGRRLRGDGRPGGAARPARSERRIGERRRAGGDGADPGGAGDPAERRRRSRGRRAQARRQARKS